MEEKIVDDDKYLIRRHTPAGTSCRMGFGGLSRKGFMHEDVSDVLIRILQREMEIPLRCLINIDTCDPQQLREVSGVLMELQ